MTAPIYVDRLPDAAAYVKLFETTGWNAKYHATSVMLMAAIESSWATRSAYDGDQLVGFGRVMSDGVMHAVIFDLIVHPAYQQRGIGSEILRQLVAACHQAGIPDVQLFAAHGKRTFYERHGFIARHEEAPGMELPPEAPI